MINLSMIDSYDTMIPVFEVSKQKAIFRNCFYCKMNARTILKSLDRMVTNIADIHMYFKLTVKKEETQ